MEEEAAVEAEAAPEEPAPAASAFTDLTQRLQDAIDSGSADDQVGLYTI